MSDVLSSCRRVGWRGRLWLYNPQHFSQEQRDEFSGLKDQQLKVARAWAMKELFSKFWEYQEAGWARRFFKDWFGWVNPSQLKPMADVVRLLKRHLENLLKLYAPSHHQRRDGGDEPKNPEHQVGGPELPQLPELPDTHPVLLRKA